MLAAFFLFGFVCIGLVLFCLELFMFYLRLLMNCIKLFCGGVGCLLFVVFSVCNFRLN